MSAAPRQELTNLLLQWNGGSQGALDQLLPFVYNELRKLARTYLRRERPGQAMQTGTLVHEAFIRLIEGSQVRWEGRAHFFGVAARLMRQILVDHARARDAIKRGAGGPADTLGSALAVAVPGLDIDVIALDRGLEELSTLDPQQARIVELRFFGGLTVEETAEVLDISTGTVKREWRMARAWLRRSVTGEPGP